MLVLLFPPEAEPPEKQVPAPPAAVVVPPEEWLPLPPPPVPLVNVPPAPPPAEPPAPPILGTLTIVPSLEIVLKFATTLLAVVPQPFNKVSAAVKLSEPPLVKKGNCNPFVCTALLSFAPELEGLALNVVLD